MYNGNFCSLITMMFSEFQTDSKHFFFLQYVIATYTGIAMLVLYFKLRPKKKTPAVADK